MRKTWFVLGTLLLSASAMAAPGEVAVERLMAEWLSKPIGKFVIWETAEGSRAYDMLLRGKARKPFELEQRLRRIQDRFTKEWAPVSGEGKVFGQTLLRRIVAEELAAPRVLDAEGKIDFIPTAKRIDLDDPSVVFLDARGSEVARPEDVIGTLALESARLDSIAGSAANIQAMSSYDKEMWVLDSVETLRETASSLEQSIQIARWEYKLGARHSDTLGRVQKSAQGLLASQKAITDAMAALKAAKSPYMTAETEKSVAALAESLGKLARDAAVVDRPPGL